MRTRWCDWSFEPKKVACQVSSSDAGMGSDRIASNGVPLAGILSGDVPNRKFTKESSNRYGRCTLILVTRQVIPTNQGSSHEREVSVKRLNAVALLLVLGALASAVLADTVAYNVPFGTPGN